MCAKDITPEKFLSLSIYIDSVQMYHVYMGVLNLRNIPDELIRKMKMRAAENGVTLKDECLEIIRRHCGVVDSAGVGETGKTDHAGRRGQGGLKGDEAQRRGNGASVPDMRKTEGAAQRLHPVQPVRTELVSGGRSEQESPHASHRTFKSGDREWCSDCKCYF